MARESGLEEIARQAINGNRDALDTLVRGIQGEVYVLDGHSHVVES
jgi:hypothetical protein